MTHSASTTNINHIPVDNIPQTNLQTFFATAYFIFFQCIAYIAAIRGDGLVTPARHLWARYYPLVAFGDELVVMPPSTLTFLITVLLAFVEIKSQSLLGFPFQTHPQLVMFSVTTLLIYGLASSVELVVSSVGLDPTSVYVVISRLGRIGSLCVLVASLASLFYF
ncbi:hypothetical protein QVD17_13334 [Tagetes erecta]|uniref:Uncharacterized protein n=1 Tax=Tagetes erecta TaxID=13708 RepID=A0AAD8L0G1_TARER|nr:hypothetical protein QVD17_13334 [Tagetes erecta]